MIGKVLRGKRAGGLLRYLFGPGRANEHTDPHLAAAWDGPRTLEPPVGVDGHRDFAPLTVLLEQPLRADARPPKKPVWHCSLRAAPGDRQLSDAEWNDVAREVLDRTGLARRGDDGGCRWVAVRHADDHVHLVVTLARQDGHRVSTSNDFYRVGEACRAVEQRYGLAVTGARDRTAAARPSRGEQEKAQRSGRGETPRTGLHRAVREAAAAAGDPEEFFTALRSGGVLVRERFSQHTPGQVTGYAVALPGDHTSAGEPVWFGGGKLAADLSWPKLVQRWGHPTSTGPPSDALSRGVRRPPATAAERAGAYRSAAHVARHAAAEVRVLAAVDPGAARNVAAGAADLLTATAHLLEGDHRGPVTAAADAFDRAAREAWGRVPARSPDGQALRAAARALSHLGRARPGDGPGIADVVLALAGLVDAVAQLRAAQAREAQALAAARTALALRAVASTAVPVPIPVRRAPARVRPPARQPELWTGGLR